MFRRTLSVQPGENSSVILYISILHLHFRPSLVVTMFYLREN